MKGAFLLSNSPSLFSDVADVLKLKGASYSAADGGVVHLVDGLGHRITVFGRVPSEAEWEYRSPPDAVAPGVDCPDLEQVTACSVECRDETWFITVIGLLAETLRDTVWVLDSNGTLWAGAEIDPSRLVL